MRKRVPFILVMAFSAACKEAYTPPVVTANLGYLVVEGFINNGPDSTVITLSHTYMLSDTSQAAPELNAKVTVEGKDNSVYPLGETGNGNYGAAIGGLNPAILYQLHIVTTSNKEYRSDFVPLKASPPIDSVNWASTSNGVQVYANTHDPQNASSYYLWSYTETWEFHSIYYSLYEYLPDPVNMIVPRPIDTFYYCWKSDASTTILLGSTAKLAQDIIYEAPIVTIPQNSWEIGIEYSIQVKQYVLTPAAYNFWLNLQKNTELIGTIFSPQPSEIPGNIHNVADSTEQVIGYMSAGTLSKSRLFIKPSQIPNWNITNYFNNCFMDTLVDNPDTDRIYLSGADGLVPVNHPSSPMGLLQGDYLIADKYCVDCTQLGTNIKPSFWQ